MNSKNIFESIIKYSEMDSETLTKLSNKKIGEFNKVKTTTTTATTPEILAQAMELLHCYHRMIESNEDNKGNVWSSPVEDIKKNIKHLKLMKIAEEYRLRS